jgi:hypothetical protein
MFLHFLNNVFLLNLPFETPERILNGFTVLNPNFGQSIHTPISGCDRPPIITYSKNNGELSVMFQPAGEAVLPSDSRTDLRGLLRNETGDRDRLSIVVFLP